MKRLAAWLNDLHSEVGQALVVLRRALVTGAQIDIRYSVKKHSGGRR
ncbi:hypothetical protein [Granulicella pectinivorans]|jgi:hypothetical protein|nr:hypothetical protein [Granulicella pectinivorans]